MNDKSTSEVHRTLKSEEPATPHQLGVHGVDEGDPQWHDDEPGLELQATNEPTQEQQGGDGREGELEVGQGGRREVEGHHGVGVRHGLTLRRGRTQQRVRHADQVVEEVIATEVGGLAERHVVGEEHPHHQRERKARKDHQHGVDDPLLLNKSSVENCQRRNTH